MSCGICTEKYTNHTRKQVNCQNCNYSACKSCYKTFLLTKSEPQCMDCKTVWDDDYLVQWFPKTWIKEDYRAHQSSVYYQREKSLFPLSMQVIERERLEQQRREYTTELNKLDDKLGDARSKNSRHQRNCKIFISNAKSATVQPCADCDKFRTEFETAEKVYTDYFNMIVKFNEDNGLNDDKHKIVSTRPCIRQGCKGYINGKWQCILCSTQFCTECREIKTAEHKCNEETVKTVKLIENDTKNCPNCKELIFKISGCDQMFCVKCNTAFSWTTGQIETGRIHNPHYFDYLNRTRQQGNAQGQGQRNVIMDENGCEEVNETLLKEAADKKSISNTDYKRFIQILLRLKIHMDEYEIGGLGLNVDQTLVNQDIRLLFLRDRIPEKQFIRTVYINLQERKRKIRLSHIYITMSNVLRDILVKFIKDPDMKLKHLQDEFVEIKKYINTELYKHAEKYNLVWFQYIDIAPNENTVERRKFIRDLNVNLDVENIYTEREFMTDTEKLHTRNYVEIARQRLFLDITLGTTRIKKKTFVKPRIAQQAVPHMLNIFDNNTRNAEVLNILTEIKKNEKEKRDYRILNSLLLKITRCYSKIFELIDDYRSSSDHSLVSVNFKALNSLEVLCCIHQIPVMCPGFPRELKTLSDGKYHMKINITYIKNFWNSQMIIIDMKPGTIHEILMAKYLIDDSPVKGSYAQWQLFYEHFKVIKHEERRGNIHSEQFKKQFTDFLMKVLNENKLKSKNSVYYNMREVVGKWWGEFYNLKLDQQTTPRPSSPVRNSGCGDPDCENCNPRNQEQREESDEDIEDEDFSDEEEIVELDE